LDVFSMLLWHFYFFVIFLSFLWVPS